MVTGGVINLALTKISGHMFSNAYSTAVLLAIYPPLGLAMVGVTILVGWARLHLGRHTLGQVVLGGVVGRGCVYLVFQLYLAGYSL